MRETVRSLRIYLFLSATLGIVINALQLTSGQLPLWVVPLIVAGAVANAGLLFLAVRLRRILSTQLPVGLHIINANFVYVGVLLVLSLVLDGGGLAAGQVAAGLLILWYIRSNLLRLSAEATSASSPARPDTATA